MIKNGGYTMLDLATATYKDVAAAFNANKPILVYDNSQVYYADTCVYDSDNDAYVITKGGKTITIDNDNNVVSSGDVANALMENIKDSNGNLRFVEGTGSIRDSVSSDVTITYNKWSLSGSHLIIVVAGTIPNGVTIANPNQIYIDYTLPSYIFDKIAAVKGNSIMAKSVDFFSSTNVISTSKIFALNKGGSLTIQQVESITTAADVGFRVQFDLLIDTE